MASKDEMMATRIGRAMYLVREGGYPTLLLNDRERTILDARLFQEPPSTYRAIGTQLGISLERVRQIQHSAIRKIRNVYRYRRDALTGQSAEDFARYWPAVERYLDG